MRIKKVLFAVLLLLNTQYPILNTLCFAQAELLSPQASSYAAAVRARVSHMVNSAQLSGEAKPVGTGTVLLSLQINRDGLLKKIQVKESSGQEELDEIASRITQMVFPFTPFPASVKESQIDMEVPVTLGQAKDIFISPVSSQIQDKKPLEGLRIYAEPVQAASYLRLEGYVRIALANNQPTKIAKEQMGLALLKIKEAERNLFPAFSGEYKTSKGMTITDPYKSLSYGVQTEQLLLGLNQVLDSVKREKIGMQLAKTNYSRLENDMRYEVSKAYYDLIGKQMLLKHWQEASKDINQDSEMIKRLYESGFAVATDFENIQSQNKLIEHQVSSVESDVALGRLTLAQAMNLENSQAELIEVSSDFGFSPQDLKIDFNECLNTAFMYRPEIQIWQKTVESAKINEIINRRENNLKFSLASSYGRSGEAFSTQKLTMVDDWSLMGKFTFLLGPNSIEFDQKRDRTLPKNITETSTKTEADTSDIKFNLFDKLNYYTANKEAQITYKQSLSELNETQKKIIFESKEAFLAYKKALSGMQTSSSRMDFKKNELKVIKARVDAGEGSPTELVESKIGFANEKASYLRSLAEYYMAVAALDKATGYQLKDKLYIQV